MVNMPDPQERARRADLVLTALEEGDATVAEVWRRVNLEEYQLNQTQVKVALEWAQRHDATRREQQRHRGTYSVIWSLTAHGRQRLRKIRSKTS